MQGLVTPTLACTCTGKPGCIDTKACTSCHQLECQSRILAGGNVACGAVVRCSYFALSVVSEKQRANRLT